MAFKKTRVYSFLAEHWQIINREKVLNNKGKFIY
jgi:hypothetical protein